MIYIVLDKKSNKYFIYNDSELNISLIYFNSLTCKIYFNTDWVTIEYNQESNCHTVFKCPSNKVVYFER